MIEREWLSVRWWIRGSLDDIALSVLVVMAFGRPRPAETP
jgi:hypothetical protein